MDRQMFVGKASSQP